MRHIAAEGRCWMIGAGCSLRSCDVPAGFPGREQLFPDPGEWLNPSDSVVVAPGGEIVADNVTSCTSGNTRGPHGPSSNPESSDLN